MLDTLKAALAATGLPFAHFGWSKAPANDYGVWAEDGAADLSADNAHAETLVEGTVDFYTRDDALAAQPLIEAALTAAGCAWYLSSIQLEDDTGYIHLEWVFQGL